MVILFFSEQDDVEEICCFDFHFHLEECARIETRVYLEGNSSEAQCTPSNISPFGVAFTGISVWIVKVVVADLVGIIQDTGDGIA